MTTKITKRDYFAELATLVNDYAADDRKDALNDFITHEIEMLEHRAATARTRKAEKDDEVMSAVMEALTGADDFMTIGDVVAKINNEDITAAKVQYRLTKLTKDGMAESTDVKVGGNRILKAYKLL